MARGYVAFECRLAFHVHVPDLDDDAGELTSGMPATLTSVLKTGLGATMVEVRELVSTEHTEP